MKIVLIVIVLVAIVAALAYFNSASQDQAKVNGANFEKITLGMTDADVQRVLGPPTDTETDPTVNPKARREKASDGFSYCHDGFFAGQFERWNDADGIHFYRVQLTGGKVTGLIAVDASKFGEDTALIPGLSDTLTLGGDDWKSSNKDGVKAKGQVKVVPKV